MTQVLSVLLVTAGVVLTTFSAAAPKSKAPPSPSDSTSNSTAYDDAPGSAAMLSAEQWRYASGIALLTLALVLSGLLGIVQDWTYARYVRAPAPTAANGPSSGEEKKASTNGHTNGHANGPAQKPVATSKAEAEAEPWQESMFYLHFLSLPMFYFVRHDLAAQARALHASPPLRLALPAPIAAPLQRVLTLYPPLGLSRPMFPSIPGAESAESPPIGTLDTRVPRAHAALALTAGTALVCVAGVHRLTARGVSALGITLLLVVRKAASLVLSVLLFRAGRGAGVNTGVWAGAGMVFAGTMGYAAGSRKSAARTAGGEKEKRE